LWGNRDRLVTREAFDEMCRVLGGPRAHTVAGTHAWLISDPDAFGEVMTNIVGLGHDAGRADPIGRASGAPGA